MHYLDVNYREFKTLLAGAELSDAVYPYLARQDWLWGCYAFADSMPDKPNLKPVRYLDFHAKAALRMREGVCEQARLDVVRGAKERAVM